MITSMNSVNVLFLSAASVAFFHSLAPDHWVPFVALAKGAKWPMAKLGWIAFIAGVGHVLSSLLLGFLGLWLGLTLHRMEGTEAWRGSVGVWLLIGFGIAYALWGLKHARHHHPHISVNEAVKMYLVRRMWILFAIMVFGPCEPLIPLMFVASKHGLATVWAMSLVFSVVTVAMVMGQSCLSYAGVKNLHAPWMDRYAHALAGLVIALTGILVLLLDI